MSTRKFGRYEIIKELGRGGMATVFLAHDPRFMREVALKALPFQFTHDSMFRTRFEREGQTIAALEHPAIVPVHDFGEESGQPFIVMRYMTGGSLSERLLKGGLSLEAATAVLSRIASALDRAHGMGIIHRDLKPDNILFDQYGDAYLADFGIAKIAEVTAALTGSGLIGTPAYMSPEQVKGETIDGRSDIYSLGIILYEMLSGKQPYEATTPWGVLSKHVNEPMPSILSKTATLPPQLDTIMTRATAKDVNDRFQTATELATAVTRITWQRPSTPTPTPTPPQPEADEPALLETIQVAVTELLSEPELLEEDIESSETSATSPPMVETEKVAEVVPATAEPEAKPAISFVAEELRPPVPKTAVPRTPKEMIASWPTWVWGVMIIALLLGVISAARGNEEETADTPAATPSAEDVPAGNNISGFIVTKWKEYFRVTDLAHGRDGWVVFMSQNSPYGRQTWRTLNEFPTDFIKTKWGEGFRVSNLNYGDGFWTVVMSQESPYGRQIWQTLGEFPTDFIKAKWEEGFRVTNLTYGDGVWAVIMSQDSPYGRQTWRTLTEFPGEFIEEKWQEGFRVTSLAYGDGQWAVIMSQDSPYGPQTWQTLETFPGDYIEQRWVDGFRMTSLAYGNGVWSVVMSKESPYGRQTWWQVPEFE